MKNISLLPAGVKSYERSSAARNMAVIAGLIVFTMFLLAYLALSAAVLHPQEELKSVRSDRAAVGKQIEELKRYEDALTDAENREQLIKQAMSDNPDWAELLTGIFDTMPEDMRLTAFTVKYGQSAGEFIMDGRAGSNTSVSNWLTSIQEAKGISDVNCGFASRDEADGGDFVEFEIRAAVRQGKVYELPAGGGTADEK